MTSNGHNKSYTKQQTSSTRGCVKKKSEGNDLVYTYLHST